jgi:acyl carrier protein
MRANRTTDRDNRPAPYAKNRLRAGLLVPYHRALALKASSEKKGGETSLSVIDTVKAVLGQTLQIGEKVDRFDAATGLFGSIAEFDSMAVVSVIAALEEKFGIVIEDDEINADIFETVGSLSQFIEMKLGA